MLGLVHLQWWWTLSVNSLALICAGYLIWRMQPFMLTCVYWIFHCYYCFCFILLSIITEALHLSGITKEWYFSMIQSWRKQEILHSPCCSFSPFLNFNHVYLCMLSLTLCACILLLHIHVGFWIASWWVIICNCMALVVFIFEIV